MTGTHLANMLIVLEDLQEGPTHDVSVHTIEAMLAGTAIPGLIPSEMHLELALAATRVADGDNATHQMGHFLEDASGEEQESGEAILGLLQSGDFQGAEHEIEELLESAVNEEEHGDSEHG